MQLVRIGADLVAPVCDVRKASDHHADRARMAAVDDVADARPSYMRHHPVAAIGRDVIGVGIQRIRVLDEVGGIADVQALRQTANDVVEERITLAGGVDLLTGSPQTRLEVVARGKRHPAAQPPGSIADCDVTEWIGQGDGRDVNRGPMVGERETVHRRQVAPHGSSLVWDERVNGFSVVALAALEIQAERP
ncbi:hypothetical protein [Nitrosospira lacus]|uniref:hypothetical protein n=1 Tax=Nitrosospira lacus TaxID=1288494 RepID=UPI00125FB514|nr:hypothetical protein [Nitrosospira lacus]